MKNYRGSYVHRGDTERRRRRVTRLALAAGFAASIAALIGTREPREANATVSGDESVPFYMMRGETRRLQAELDEARGNLDLANAQLEKAQRVIKYSAEYGIAADLARTIIDVALAEGIEPDLAFRLVRVESEFNPRAVSPVGALGLTQLMPATARYFQKGVTREQLFEPQTNLRIGFRYLRTLIRQNKGNVQLALLVYNRGPVAVKAALAQGIDPSNGYERAVMRGYSGDGTVE